MTRAADRALETLQHLADHTEIGVAELAELMRIDKASAHRLLASLTKLSFATQVPETRRYRLGPEASRVGYSYVKAFGMRRTLERLADATGEPATLVVYNGGTGLVLDRVEAGERRPVVTELGARVPMHAGASCKALMAFLPPEEIEWIIERVGLYPKTRFTITDPDRLRQELAEIRRLGYALSFHEVQEEHVGVGAPILGYKGRCIGAISVAGPASHYPPEQMERFINETVRAAREASSRLGSTISGPSAY